MNMLLSWQRDVHVHVHGSYWVAKLRNAEQEHNEATKQTKGTSVYEWIVNPLHLALHKHQESMIKSTRWYSPNMHIHVHVHARKLI